MWRMILPVASFWPMASMLKNAAGFLSKILSDHGMKSRGLAHLRQVVGQPVHQRDHDGLHVHVPGIGGGPAEAGNMILQSLAADSKTAVS